MSAQPKPRIRCTEPPQAMCGWCARWDVFDNLQPPSRFMGNDWPIHPACMQDWFDGDGTLRHSENSKP